MGSRGCSKGEVMNVAPKLEVVTPDPKVHLPEMFEMCAKVFSGGQGYFGIVQWCRDAYIMHSHYDWKTATIGLLDGKIVTHLGVWGFDMRIGKARVRVAGVGLVATHADYRKHGFGGQTLRRSMELMRAHGYDMTYLSGITGYYDRFGYVRAWDMNEFAMEAQHLPAAKPGMRIRKFEPGHREDLARLYNRENATRTGTAVRPTFLRNPHPGKWVGYLWEDARGKVAGYVVVSPEDDALRVRDFAGDDGDTLAVLGFLVHKLHLKTLVFHRGVHHDNPMRKRLTQQAYSWSKTVYRSSGGPMICMINLASTLTKLSGELSERLKKSCAADWRGSLLIADGREKVSLVIDRSRVKVGPAVPSKHSISGGPHIVRLLLGSDEPAEVVKDGGMKLTGDAPALIEALVPNNHPHQSAWDLG